MSKLFGNEYSKKEFLKKTGNLSQIGGMKEYTFNSGRARGVDAIDVNAGDLQFTVLNSRCLDIGQANFEGLPFGYISKSGLPEVVGEVAGKAWQLSVKGIEFNGAGRHLQGYAGISKRDRGRCQSVGDGYLFYSTGIRPGDPNGPVH